MNKEKLINPKIHLIVLCLVVGTEFIGAKKLNVGFGVIALFPMLYALVLGGIVSFPSLKLLKEKEMSKASNILGISFVLLVAKLGTMLGPSIMKVFNEGWALLFQEVGHFIGTIVIALPVAVFLGMKREAIGATYSIDRENNLAIISEKFGVESQESKGAIGVYICGTLFGAIYLGLLASILGGTGIFHPLALAMGAGVGSGSMMAAAAGALVVLFPEFKNDILVFSGAANLATTILGTFVCAFISLPLAERFYNWLEPRIGRRNESSLNIERSINNEE
jgi:Protein of unknown function (DUF3100).